MVQTKRKSGIGRSARGPKTTRFHIRLEPELLAKIKKRASALGLDVNQYIASLVRVDLAGGGALLVVEKELSPEFVASVTALQASVQALSSAGKKRSRLAKAATTEAPSWEKTYLAKSQDLLQTAFAMEDPHALGLIQNFLRSGKAALDQLEEYMQRKYLDPQPSKLEIQK